ncbi:hypothetical protein HYT53_01345 [Candidatus Woesearchaeota archaeon]|nr:hypothetical protein [Candidatus Woesearchaeota archaeon]
MPFWLNIFLGNGNKPLEKKVLESSYPPREILERECIPVYYGMGLTADDFDEHSRIPDWHVSGVECLDDLSAFKGTFSFKGSKTSDVQVIYGRRLVIARFLPLPSLSLQPVPEGFYFPELGISITADSMDKILYYSGFINNPKRK